MKRHFKRVRKCQNPYRSQMSYEECAHISTNRLFIFLDKLDPIRMSDDLIRAILISCNKSTNYITKECIVEIKQMILSNHRSVSIIQDSKKEYHIYGNRESIDTSYDSISLSSSLRARSDGTDQMEEENDNVAEIKSTHAISSFTESMNDESTEDHICGQCGNLFSTKYSLMRHMSRKGVCKKNRQYNENKEMVEKKQKKRESIQNISEESTSVHIYDQSNHIHNVQNNNIHNNNSLKLDVKDFIHDIYDHTHIDYHGLSTDFYILKNFLALLMENKTNQNIFFNDDIRDGALVYTREDIRKMPCDKAGFIMLEKLYMTMDDMIQHVIKDESDREKFSFMSRYYKKILEKYRCDTIYREYNQQTHTFYNTHQGRQLRSRDEYLADIMSVVRKYNLSMEDNLLCDIHPEGRMSRYTDINPNIEDFASTRVRYRDLKA